MAKILLIDDEELVVDSLVKLLKRQNHEIVSTSNASRAIELIKKNEFDLIVTDIRMPGVNGIEMIAQIRELLTQRGRNQIPEICITGYADEALIKKAEDLCVADYLYKPFNLSDFLECINRNLKKV